MSHDTFEERMEDIRRLTTEIYQAEVVTFYNVSKASAKAIDNAIAALEIARDYMAESV